MPIPVVIPSYEPDERFPAILKRLKDEKLGPVIVVDDGSGEDYAVYFKEAEQLVKPLGGTVLRHDVNRGKGRALKTAFSYILENMPGAVGCVTADSDGQHSVDSIRKCMDALIKSPDDLILGVRDFSKENVPYKSRFGNNLTIRICSYLCGVKVSDTQTGLRGIPSKFMRELLDVEGERFEFETRMLIVTKDKYQITEVPIETIYDSKENHQTHFNPVKDSIRIYKIFGEIFLKFTFASVSSSAIDLSLFYLFCRIFDNIFKTAVYAAAATIAARVISSVYNYLVNYKMVFKSGRDHRSSFPRYVLLAVVQMLLSSSLVALLVALMPGINELVIKIPVDIILFMLSFYIQRRFVY